MADNFTRQEESSGSQWVKSVSYAEDGGQLTVTIIYNISEVEHHLLLQKYRSSPIPWHT
jgi:hypothetical protein